MKQVLIFIAMWLFHFTTTAQQIAKVEQIEIRSEILQQNRPILMYTPWLYDERNLVSFDVIYVFDAQNRELFDLVHSVASFIPDSRKAIVVGITSPSFEELEYYRNYDYLPQPLNVPLNRYQTDKPNAENFWKFVEQEVFTYIDALYRTTGRKYAVGHSLSGSFVLDKMIHRPDVFHGVISISPNLAYDNYRLANDFTKKDFSDSSEAKFIYLSQGNELSTWGDSWAKGYTILSNFLKDSNEIKPYSIHISEFPTYNHWNTYLPAITEGLGLLGNFVKNNPYTPYGEEQLITIRVTVPEKEDEAFITGNQNSLGNWDPTKIKLINVSDTVREITVKVKFPMEFKITRGSWESQAYTDQSTNLAENIVISSLKSNFLCLKVEEWNDK